jgi:PP-loop superfamily ATP-utilizing enzyme
MPAWQPNWNDVVYDFEGAEDAIVRARACRRVLEDRPGTLAAALDAAREQWRGAKRVEFDLEEEHLARRNLELIDQLDLAERRVRLEIDEAHAEQARRVAERERFWQELREEEARAREAERVAAEAAARQAALAVAVGTTTTTTTTTVPPLAV